MLLVVDDDDDGDNDDDDDEDRGYASLTRDINRDSINLVLNASDSLSSSCNLFSSS